MFGKISAPQPLALYALAAIAALALGFAITHGLAREDTGSQSKNTSLAAPASDKDQDGLVGPVNSVRTETAKLLLKSGSLREESRELLELTTYDVKGNRVDSSYYLVSGNARPGREEYAYDNKGNISEMTLRDNNNSILSKEIYKYDYDAVGNWTRMMTSRVVYEGGRLSQQPVEATYRNITYYFDQAISDMVKSAPAGTERDLGTLRNALDEWIAATNARDVEKLMGFYDAKVGIFYRAREVSREFVRAEKTRLFRRSDFLEVRAGAPEITIIGDGGTATMRFHKQYDIKEKGNLRSGEVLQQLIWRRSGGAQWKIVGERDAQVIR
ncbi:MAG TPA: nuclear transport factor 2 family protein [Pyrinomonadaceae bacterium]|jgi:YD repeat-containing protein